MDINRRVLVVATVVIFIAVLYALASCCLFVEETEPQYDLPDVSAIMLNPSDTFIAPLNQFFPGGFVEGIVPMPGTDSGSCYHPGAHVDYVATGTLEMVNIYAPLDGVITHVDKCFPTEGQYDNQQYKIHMAYAQRDNDLFELELGMEPMAGKPCDSNPEYFTPYIMVSEGEEVQKGQLLGRMVLLPGYKSHIHFNSKFRGVFMCPDFFKAEVIGLLDDHYMDSCEGNPYSSISTGTICYLPSLGESHDHY